MKIKKRDLWLGFAILWMVIIFSFSTESASVSDERSGMIAEIFGNILSEGSANHIIRKTAHFIEYGLLALLYYKAFYWAYKEKKNRQVEQREILEIGGKSVVCTFIYSCTDEIHQLFVPGRSGQIMDVILDTAGGIFVIIIILVLYNKKYDKKRGFFR